MHAVADGQDIPQSQSSRLPGVGVFWIDHLLPFQRSARVTFPIVSEAVERCPTATHAVAEVHETASRPTNPSFGVCCIVHREPFQRSTTARNPKLLSTMPSVYGPPPTAVQATVDVHDTPLAKKRLGTRWIDHRDPSQRSTSAFGAWRGVLLNVPTAIQKLRDVHVTSSSSLTVDPAGTGVRWIVQFVPFQRSANATPPWGGVLPPWSVWTPTAKQAFVDTHEIAPSAPSPGDGITRQLAAVAGAALATHDASATHAPRARATIRRPPHMITKLCARSTTGIGSRPQTA